jgi:hypothetical protein
VTLSTADCVIDGGCGPRGWEEKNQATDNEKQTYAPFFFFLPRRPLVHSPFQKKKKKKNPSIAAATRKQFLNMAKKSAACLTDCCLTVFLRPHVSQPVIWSPVIHPVLQSFILIRTGCTGIDRICKHCKSDFPLTFGEGECECK